MEDCPTDEMIADFFTNTLQGSLVRKDRRIIMGEPDVLVPVELTQKAQECIGTSTVDCPLDQSHSQLGSKG